MISSEIIQLHLRNVIAGFPHINIIKLRNIFRKLLRLRPSINQQVHGLALSFWYEKRMVASGPVSILESLTIELPRMCCLPSIEDSLDCLDGATIFTSLDLQSGYWQVERTEGNRPLTAFTVGPLGFYGCI